MKHYIVIDTELTSTDIATLLGSCPVAVYSSIDLMREGELGEARMLEDDASQARDLVQESARDLVRACWHQTSPGKPWDYMADMVAELADGVFLAAEARGREAGIEESAVVCDQLAQESAILISKQRAIACARKIRALAPPAAPDSKEPT
jgi:hypothetical protein